MSQFLVSDGILFIMFGKKWENVKQHRKGLKHKTKCFNQHIKMFEPTWEKFNQHRKMFGSAWENV